MRICLVQSALTAGAVGRLADLLRGEHEVVVIGPEIEPVEDLAGLAFAGEEHRRAAAVLAAVRAAYGDSGPDYLEIPDAGPDGLVLLQARRTGDPLLARTLIGVRVSPSLELRAIHDGTLGLAAQRRVAELEREQLRLADRLIWPGGDSLELYRRYYAGVALPEAIRIGIPGAAQAPPIAAPQDLGAPLRILFVGALEQHAGVLDLVEACLSLEREDWELELVGDDSETATMGQSMRLTIEAMAADDERIRFADGIELERLGERLPEFDLLVAPARVEGWSEVAVEAARAGVPVLATPVGGLTEIVADGVSGWQTTGIGPEAIARALSRLAADRGELARVRGSAAIAAHAAGLVDSAPTLAAYRRLAETAAADPRVVASAAAEPLITGVIPYYGLPEHVGEAVASLLAQSHRNLEVLIVNDGSFAAADSVLEELAADPRVSVVTQPNRGESTARNLGTLLARGEYVVMLDADNALEPEFAARALAAFARDPRLPYVTCWLRNVDESGVEPEGRYGYAPLGNAVIQDETRNWDGDTIAMLPRALFAEHGYCFGPEGSMHSDWELYRWLRADGRFGIVIPERLARYRVRLGSLLRAHSDRLQAYGWSESQSRNLQRGMRWIADPD